ncbi:SAM-dependent methyltransferase [Ignavibacterium album JCM 16511]|uniref:SAM-dependent methyltransferase n=1 Tax=Ignavibacterium album (strain DSM 19864 / JCM 16511 / NBRC 101810 / Mat9-16) TaxID=945713 RepID=I0AJ13_IGNAJ|nr:class I SAM-dependent methyltransferase [Ignavibacterium album]AFH48970.1 SAM-dependent methyltransferase [Ignavibacterium album JCM 16511]
MQDELKNFDYLNHYKTDAEEFDYFENRIGAAEHEERRVREVILSQVDKNVKTILDVGCGSGWVAKEFLKKNIKVISLDISKSNPQKVKELYPSQNHYQIVADSFKLPFHSNSIDCVIASEIIEHVVEPKLFLKELFRVVSRDGRLIISTPYKEKIRYVLCIHCNEKTPVNAHLHSFDENILRDLYNRDDFKKFSSIIFGNKALIYLRTHILLKYLPLSLWLAVDWLANKIYNKPLHIVSVYQK